MQNRILRTPADLNAEEICALYKSFNVPIMDFDCGQKCSPHNPSGKPFCCDICHAVPAAYPSEWETLKDATAIWHRYRGDECASPSDLEPATPVRDEDMPPGMIPLACLGPDRCERENRLLSCRQFPFFPYVTSDYRFIGLASDWEFEPVCGVLSNLGQVSDAYRKEFVHTFDRLFALFQDEFDSYALRSQEMRTNFIAKRRRIPLLHRDGGYRLISPASERLRRADESRVPQFGPYR